MERNVKIAFCEEREPTLSYLISRLQEVFLEREVPGHFEIYGTFGELQTVLASGKGCDVCFLNVDRGFEAVEQITRQFPHILFIFTAEREDLVYEALRYHPFAFLRELRLEEDMGWVIQALGEHFQALREPYCEVRDVTGHLYRIALGQIIYLKAEDKYVNIVTHRGGLYLRNTLSNLEKSLKSYGVVRIHRSFLVNIREVAGIKYGKVMLKNGQQLPLGRSWTSKVREVYRNQSQ